MKTAETYLAIRSRYKAGQTSLDALFDFAMSLGHPCSVRHHATDWKERDGTLVCPLCAAVATMPPATKGCVRHSPGNRQSWCYSCRADDERDGEALPGGPDPLLRAYAEGQIDFATYQERRKAPAEQSDGET